MRIYVATAWGNREQAKSLAEKLERLGHEITHKWWEIDAAAKAGVWERDGASLVRTALDDLGGVLDADALVYIDHLAANAGRTELGIALGCDIPCVVLWDPETRPNVFFYLPGVTRCQTEADVLAHFGVAAEVYQ